MLVRSKTSPLGPASSSEPAPPQAIGQAPPDRAGDAPAQPPVPPLYKAATESADRAGAKAPQKPAEEEEPDDAAPVAQAKHRDPDASEHPRPSGASSERASRQSASGGPDADSAADPAEDPPARRLTDSFQPAKPAETPADELPTPRGLYVQYEVAP